MKTSIQGQVIGIPISSLAYQLEQRSAKALLTDAATQYHTDKFPQDVSSTLKRSKVDSVLNRMNKLGKKADIFAHGIKEHVRLGPKITETVKGKLSLGARILQVGGVEKIFKQLFSAREGEKLLKASQCYLSTTAGPIAGLLFISTDKIAFCSEKSIKFSSPNGELIRARYKVVIPVNKIKGANQSENVKKPAQKYIEIVTVDNFDFWFMGFLNYQKAFKYLQQAVSQA
ncbi:GRAM domain containing protein [Parasponia andersonii]|uniref:GRAM domain containing protein n=1 Tax=Parasponia andersonii TaxID=3476 RepID=A0A2P5D4G5_PARAD|nr:GRAM domain containing protein [Parasponia andersonii]